MLVEAARGEALAPGVGGVLGWGMRPWIALALAVPLLVAADADAISKRQCRRACAPFAGYCASELATSRRKCLRMMVRACRQDGHAGYCAEWAPVPGSVNVVVYDAVRIGDTAECRFRVGLRGSGNRPIPDIGPGRWSVQGIPASVTGGFEECAGGLDPGGERRCRLYFALPTSITYGTLRFASGDGAYADTEAFDGLE